MKFCPWVGLFVTAMALSGTPQASQSTAQEDFSAGVAAFQGGNITRAKMLLEQARNAGLDSASLLYNLGVVYFRLGLFERARATFIELLDTQHAPLARYNLGLVLQKKGDTEGARAWFNRAADESSPDQIQALARRQLAKSASTVSPVSDKEADSTRMAGFFSTAAGYDDNISSTPSSATTNQASVFGDALASGRVYFEQDSGSALQLDGVAYTRQYPGNAEFDNTYFSAGTSWHRPLGGARLRSGVTVAGFWFGADLLEQQVELDITFERSGCFGSVVPRLDCEVEVSAAKIKGGSGFSFYDGESFGGELSIEKNTPQWTLGTAYRLDIDQRDDLATETEFFSFSPTRHQISFDVERQFNGSFSLGISQAFRASRYADPHVMSDNGQLRTDTREDDRFRSLLFGRYQLDRRWRIGMELALIDNQSSLERYQYQRREFLLSLDGMF